MKKKIFVISLAVAMFAVALAGGTIAYLTAQSGQRNTMTVGNVTIEQIEEQRVYNPETGEYEDGIEVFNEDSSPILLPAIYDEYGYDGSVDLGNGGAYNIFNETIEGEIDKFVFVENTGNTDAYIRTILAFEDKKLEGGSYLTEKLHALYGNVNTLGSDVNATWDMTGGTPFPADKDIVWLMDGNDYLTITLPDPDDITGAAMVTYTIAVATYDLPVAPGNFTEPSLMQIWLESDAGNDWIAQIGTRYNILVLSQAVQANFNSAVEAFDAAFPLTEANLIAWLTSINN